MFKKILVAVAFLGITGLVLPAPVQANADCGGFGLPACEATEVPEPEQTMLFGMAVAALVGRAVLARRKRG